MGTYNDNKKAGIPTTTGIPGLHHLTTRGTSAYVDLDFVPGYLVRAEPFHHEAWGGLGLVIVDDVDDSPRKLHSYGSVGYPVPDMIAEYRSRASAEGPRDLLFEQPRGTIAELEQQLTGLVGSRSWRITSRLRDLAGRIRR